MYNFRFLYRDKGDTTASKVCYVEFEDSQDASVALHLNNVVFVDRAIIVSLTDCK